MVQAACRLCQANQRELVQNDATVDTAANKDISRDSVLPKPEVNLVLHHRERDAEMDKVDKGNVVQELAVLDFAVRHINKVDRPAQTSLEQDGSQ